jgi:hypothetical protein
MADNDGMAERRRVWDYGIARIERAREFVAELRELLADQDSAEQGRIVHSIDAETGEDVWELLWFDQPPDWRISVAVGDVAHSIRTALNQLAYTFEPKQTTEFPIYLEQGDPSICAKYGAFQRGRSASTSRACSRSSRGNLRGTRFGLCTA